MDHGFVTFESARTRGVRSGIAGKMATEDIDRAKVLQESPRSRARRASPFHAARRTRYRRAAGIRMRPLLSSSNSAVSFRVEMRSRLTNFRRWNLVQNASLSRRMINVPLLVDRECFSPPSFSFLLLQNIFDIAVCVYNWMFQCMKLCVILKGVGFEAS